MKLIIIGCPGAGKSVLARRINDFLHYPVLHLDKIYHTGGKSHITREELISKVSNFTNINDRWIIDGNYISTLEMRVNLADTIILLNIPTEICMTNACKRAEENLKQKINRDDMAYGFDHTITKEFIDFIKNFEKDTMPEIKAIVAKFPDKNVRILNDYSEVDKFVARTRMEYEKHIDKSCFRIINT